MLSKQMCFQLCSDELLLIFPIAGFRDAGDEPDAEHDAANAKHAGRGGIGQCRDDAADADHDDVHDEDADADDDGEWRRSFWWWCK